jgi:hypothetical protein
MDSNYQTLIPKGENQVSPIQTLKVFSANSRHGGRWSLAGNGVCQARKPLGSFWLGSFAMKGIGYEF